MEWIDRKLNSPEQEQGVKIIALNYNEDYIFECEDGYWCSLGGDDFTHWMPRPNAPIDNEST